MIFLVCHLVEKNGMLIKQEHGLVWGGNHRQVIEKTCELIGHPMRFRSDCVKSNNEYVFSHRTPEDPDSEVIHRLLISCPNELVTIFEYQN